MGRIAIENATHFHDRAGKIDFLTKNFGAVRRGKDGAANVQADFAPINIKGRHHFNVTRPVGTDLAMHQSDSRTIVGRPAVEVYPLNQRTGAITNTDDGDSDFSHSRSCAILSAAEQGGQGAKLLFQRKLVVNFN
jgi:hypothetical protein